MALKFWTNQTVQVQTALGAAQTITGISKASSGVITKDAGAVLPTNGQYVLLEVNGMQQVNKRVFKVSSASGSTFQIGTDTTQFGTFSSGTYRVITFGQSFNALREPSTSGGEPVFEDTTTIHDANDNQAIISSSAETFAFTHDWEPTNAALVLCNTAFITRTPLAFRIADPDNSEYLFYASVSAPLSPQVGGRKKVTRLSMSLQAPGTAY